jgi:hypothetical protein
MHFLSGIAGAAACWTKQSAFTSVLFVFVYIGLAARYPEGNAAGASRSAPIRALTSWLLGAGVFSALLILYFHLHGILSEFFYWIFIYNFSYVSRHTLGQSLGDLKTQLLEIIRGDFLIVGLGVAVALWRLASKRRDAYFTLGFLFLSLLGAIPGFEYSHYFAQLAPAVAIACGYGLFTLLGHCPSRRQLAASVVAGVLILAVPIIINSSYFLERNPNKISRLVFGYNPFPESKALAAFVAAATVPGDPVFIVGSEPQILFYARRSSTASFLLFYPLMASHPRYKEFQETTWKEIQRTPPKYVLAMVSIPTSFLWDGKADPEIVRRLDNWLSREYAIERVMLVTGFAGEWVGAADSRVRKNVPRIYVLRRMR